MSKLNKKQKYQKEKLLGDYSKTKMKSDVLEKYSKYSKKPKKALKVPMATKRSGKAKRILSKLGGPGKAAAVAWTAYDLAKMGYDALTKETVCKAGEVMNAKGQCVLPKKKLKIRRAGEKIDTTKPYTMTLMQETNKKKS